MMPVTIFLPVGSKRHVDLLLITDAVVPGAGDVVKSSVHPIMTQKQA
jgi:hypothetical protein